VLVLSVWVAIDGAVFGLSGLQVCDTALHGNTTYLCDSVPEFSVLWHPFVGGLHITGGRPSVSAITREADTTAFFPGPRYCHRHGRAGN